jgi:hypothetical protein
MRLDRRRFLVLAGAAVLSACAGTESRSVASRAGARVARELPRPRLTVARPHPHLWYLRGSTVRVEQVVGDVDHQTKLPTRNLTQTRFGIVGTDLGSSWEHDGRLYFVFGDTIGAAEDPIAVSTVTDPDAPLALDFLSEGPGRFVSIRPSGVSMREFEVPIAGISVDGVQYVAVKTDYFAAQRAVTRSVLTRFDERTRTFTPLRDLSRLLEGGKFIDGAFHLTPDGQPGMPGPGPHVLMFGSGQYRRSPVSLSAVPTSGFASGSGLRYFAGTLDGEPQWSPNEADAMPLVEQATYGELSVAYIADLGLWVLLGDGRFPTGILMRFAPNPWGPWSEPATIFNGVTDGGRGVFIHEPNKDDGLAGPVASLQDPRAIPGSQYGAYLIERFARVDGDELSLDYLMSTWNPYTVVRMRSRFAILD